MHYPYRIGAIYLINATTSFNFLWGMMKGMLPKRLEKQVTLLIVLGALPRCCAHDSTVPSA